MTDPHLGQVVLSCVIKDGPNEKPSFLVVAISQNILFRPLSSTSLVFEKQVLQKSAFLAQVIEQ
jgi:hypothetical protein